MDQQREDRIWEMVRRRVLWGEPKEDVMRNLAANGVAGSEAESLYRGAMRERVAIIRAASGKRMLVGALCLAAGIGVLKSFFVGAGAGPGRRYGLAGGALAAVFGAWWLIDGIGNYLLAHRRGGSVADDV